MELKQFIEELTKNRTAEACFTALKNVKNLKDYSPSFRTAILLNYVSSAKSRVLKDSEHGIDGMIVLGSAEVWNKEEFSPWTIQDQTVVLGNLTIEGTLNILDGGFLYVAKDLELECLNIFDGEVHCAGKIIAENVFQTKNSFLFEQGAKVT